MLYNNLFNHSTEKMPFSSPTLLLNLPVHHASHWSTNSLRREYEMNHCLHIVPGLTFRDTYDCTVGKLLCLTDLIPVC